jgi:hypothetical protein
MEIGAICDIDPAKAEVARSTYSGVPFYTDYMSITMVVTGLLLRWMFNSIRCLAGSL